MDRSIFIPKGATKVADKASDAVAYLYVDRRDRPCAHVFFGRKARPFSACYYANLVKREQHVKMIFERRRQQLLAKGEAMRDRREWQPDYKVGDLLETCWGYEQTNREYFEIIETRGKHVIVREIQQARTYDGQDRGKCTPLPGSYKGEPLRRLAQQRGIKIDNVRFAYRVEMQTVAGVQVAPVSSWTAYH